LPGNARRADIGNFAFQTGSWNQTSSPDNAAVDDLNPQVLPIFQTLIGERNARRMRTRRRNAESPAQDSQQDSQKNKIRRDKPNTGPASETQPETVGRQPTRFI
jgi:hypothetical protein